MGQRLSCASCAYLSLGASVKKPQYSELAANFVLFWLHPEAHLPTNWSTVFLLIMAQLGHRQIEATGRQAVLPIETWVTAPFRIEFVTK